MPEPVSRAYLALAEAGHLEPDSEQIRLADRLDALLAELCDRRLKTKKSALGWVLARGRWREGGLVDLLLLLPFAVPATVLGAGMIELWVSGPLSYVYGTPAFLSLAIGIRVLPFAVRPVVVAASA